MPHKGCERVLQNLEVRNGFTDLHCLFVTATMIAACNNYFARLCLVSFRLGRGEGDKREEKRWLAWPQE
jgi:hypothetical protein